MHVCIHVSAVHDGTPSNNSTQEAESDICEFEASLGLDREFQGSQDYIVRPSLTT